MIAILAHWHTGSSCLAHTLFNAGMGIDSCSYNDNFEHLELNGIGSEIYHGSGFRVDDFAKYIKRFDKKNVGFKITHALQERCWAHLKEFFDDAKIVISMRHPYDIYMSTRAAGWSIEKVLESWVSTREATMELKDRAEFVFFPESYINGSICDVIKRLGLNYDKDKQVFNNSKINNLTDRSVADEEVLKINSDALEFYNHMKGAYCEQD